MYICKNCEAVYEELPDDSVCTQCMEQEVVKNRDERYM
jgi:hypothetical protein